MASTKTHFQEDARHIVIVEEAPDMESAEREADNFLSAESRADEAGACFIRVQCSGIKRENRYHFKVVSTSGPLA
jgi:hypothetical protein